ncbi:hypothetical protein [Streptomyces sp. NBC_01363]|uniref:hypothetical protein n=1 Tax=Streptomyces sp. NBC_01363 TaxID=2903840 RepID=UPI002259C9AE|nr:hypothetical protein [Streptomyces sp. NBC_01363]MCX4736814.1 hypothetical protein [Streptomyces sp. NBC_01363]
MADLLWDDVNGFFDPDLMGPLPDVLVPETSLGTGRRSSISAVDQVVLLAEPLVG